MTNIRAAAKTIAAARRNRTPLPPFSAEAAPQSEAEGYRIQDAVHGLLAADLGALVGYKIGCTSPVMQQYLDIPHPCGGGVFANGVFDSGASLRTGNFVRVGVPDVLHVAGRALINGVEVGRGSGADVLGHPHDALAWLANHLAADGKNLRAGQLVLTGSLVKTVWLKAGDEVVMELEGLGRVSATFS